MFMAYRDKMVAALLFEPIPRQPAVYHIRIRRPRVLPAPRQANASFNGVFAA